MWLPKAWYCTVEAVDATRVTWHPPVPLPSSRQHAAELGNAIPEEPLLFLKPTTSYVKEGSPIVVSTGVHLDTECMDMLLSRGNDVYDPLRPLCVYSNSMSMSLPRHVQHC